MCKVQVVLSGIREGESRMGLEIGTDPYSGLWRRVRRLQELKRRAFCYTLALSWAPPGAATPVSSSRVSIAARVSLVLPFARQLRQFIRRRPGFIQVDPACLLVGAQGGPEAIAFAEALGGLCLGS